MRIAIVTESFLPCLNGVTTSVCRLLDRLAALRHEALVVAPRPAPTAYGPFPVCAVDSVPVRQFNVGLPSRQVHALLTDFAPDVVHAASPFALGARGLVAALDLGMPSVAVYQTDVAAYVRGHGRAAGRPAAHATWAYLRWVHSLADLNLAPSRAALADLTAHGIERTALWGRGIDSTLFHRRWRDDAGCRALRRALAPRGEVVVGYVGRLAPEKEVERLADLSGLPGVRVAVVGDGPSRAEVARALPDAVLLGRREGDDLARAYAALDVFVHTGPHETFGQTLQEAAATALPVIAPARGGPLDLVAHGHTGWLFDPDRPGSLRAAVASLTTAEDAWERRALFGEAGAAAVRDRGWPALVDHLLAHYATLTPASAPTAAAARHT